MGIMYHGAKMLLDARLRGVCFSSTATLGRQSLVLYPAEVLRLQQTLQAHFPQAPVRPLGHDTTHGYADDFFRNVLGATSLTVVDYSSYQGADTLHDFNLPVPESLWNRFDAVVEAGSLEHIFNFPVAVANLMKMAKVGGSVFVMTACNNLSGHGFYQFSPELMFRVFTPENGFALQRLVLLEAEYPTVELTQNRRVYEVVDPAQVHTRVGLVNSKPVMLMLEAKKTADVPLFARAPLQSDYLTLWDQGPAQARRPNAAMKLRRLIDKLPRPVRARLLGWRERRRYSFANHQFYKKV